MINLRPKTRPHLKQGFDVIVGIPSYNNERYVGNVAKTVATGLARYLKDLKSLILVCDGGSLDDTREVAGAINVPSGIERIVTTYKGIPGKGSAVMAMIEAAMIARAKLLLLYDADLRSITPE
ncbi:MAG TPA: cell wall biosynthesis glycosyltransferase, partial [bacterium (Candidatus Stahlbacteria)]|nr:cell wall biosynthesis glycosyltransferase [Candidatus Stahlbacteria bacterium]